MPGARSMDLSIPLGWAAAYVLTLYLLGPAMDPPVTSGPGY